MSKFVTVLGLFDVPLIGDALKGIWNMIWRFVYGLYFTLVKVIAWVLDMLTQLFYIFSGMTPVSSNTPSSSDGAYEEVDLVNFFLTQKSFQKAYLYLCLIALGLIVVFAIAKIIKQDYFDRNGPRSKGPIFRNILLSFIAFICIIPVFYFLIDAAAALALMVMKAMGYKGGGIGTMIFNICWDDDGDAITSVANGIGYITGYHKYTVNDQVVGNFFYENGLRDSGNYNANLFSWPSTDTFYVYYWDANEGTWNKNLPAEFYWYTYIFTGLIMISTLGKMLLSMLHRMYNMIALFIVSPSPISQIVLDDGAMFKKWKDRTVQEAVRVVACVMSFMLFIMIISVVNNLDLMKYAFMPEAASASLLESNSLTTELSNSVSPMYYYGEEISMIDKAINALGKCMIIVAGGGAIQDIDKIVTPFLAGGNPNEVGAFASGATGTAVSNAGKIAANTALGLGQKTVGLAVKGATAAVGLAGSIGAKSLEALNAGIRSGRNIAGTGENTGGPGGGLEMDSATGPSNAMVDENGVPIGAGPDKNNDKNGIDPNTPTPTNDGGGKPEEASNAEQTNTPDPNTSKPKDGEGETQEEASDAKPTSKSGDDTRSKELDPVDVQKMKTQESKKKLDDAREKLAAAKAKERKMNTILKNIDAIDKSKSMSDEEKQERISQLEKEYDSLEANDTPSVEDAQNEFDSSQAAFQMDSRELRGMGGDLEYPSVQAVQNSNLSGNNGSGNVETGDNLIGGEDSTTPQGSTGTITKDTDSGNDTPTSAKGSSATGSSGGSSNTNVRFATMNDADKPAGKSSWVGRGIKGTLGITGGLSVGATKAAFGIVGAALKTGGSLVGTAAKTGLSAAGMIARATLQMTGLGGVASAATGFVGGVVDDTKKSLGKMGKSLQKSAVSAGGQLKELGGHIKDGAKGVANSKLGQKVAETKVVQKVGTAAKSTVNFGKRVVNGAVDAGGIVGGLFKAGAKITDAVDKGVNGSRTPEYKKELTSLASDSTFKINDNVDTLKEGSSSIETSVASGNMEKAGEQLEKDMETMNNNAEKYCEERNTQLDRKVDLGQAIKEKREADENLAAAEMRNDSVHNYANSAPTRSKEEVKLSQKRSKSAAKTDLERNALKHGISERQEQLKDKYSTAIKAFEESKSSGAKLSDENSKEYGEYVQESNKLDNAYRYVDGDTTVSDEQYKEFGKDFASVKSSVTETESYSNVKADVKSSSTSSLENYRKDMVQRSDDAEQYAADRFEKTSAVVGSATVADHVHYANQEFKTANENYKKAVEGGKASEIKAAKAELHVAGVGLQTAARNANSQMVRTKDAVIDAGARNVKLNKANAKYDSARNQARQNIDIAKANGATSTEIAKMEREFSSIDKKAISHGVSKKGKPTGNLYQERKRDKIKVTATKDMKKFAKKTEKAVSPIKKSVKNGGAGVIPTVPKEKNVSGSKYEPIEPVEVETEFVGNTSFVNKSFVDNAISKGVNSKELGDAYGEYKKIKEDSDKESKDSFVDSISKVNSINVGALKSQIELKLKKFTPTEAQKESGYVEKVKKRHEEALRDYNDSIGRAKKYADEYKGLGDDGRSAKKKEKAYKQVEQALADAISRSAELADINVEIGIEDKKEDK